jgi:hypothetical protein
MATLEGSTIASTYTYLLKMDATGGVTGSLVKVQDGDATDSSLSVSTVAISIDATDKFYLDGGGDTYIHESAANVVQILANDVVVFEGDANSRYSMSNNDSGTSNTIFGYLAGDKIASGGTDNTLIGNQVGNQTSYGITTGDHNTGVGSDALGGSAGAHITGSYNTAIGSSSLLEAEGAVTNNTCVGYASGANITTGDKNTFIGTTAGDGFDVESSNIGIGYSAFGGAVNGADKCIAIGNDSLSGAATQDGTIAIGHDALAALTSGAGNVAVGYQALASNLTDTNRNIAIGYQAGKLHSGDDNIIIGYQAFDAADSGEDNNVVIGSGAGGAINDTSSDFNVIIGTVAGSGGAAAMISCVVIGESAMNSTVGNAQTGTIAIGKDALTALTSGAGNIAIGLQAMSTHTTGAKNIAIGYQSMLDTNAGSTSLGSTENVFIGYQSGSGTWADAASNYNVAVGNSTMRAVLNGALNNTAVGYNALSALTSADKCVAIGAGSLAAITQGGDNTAIGYNAMGGATTHAGTVGNVAIGNNALDLIGTDSSSQNVAIGYNSGTAVTSGDDNCLVGHSSGDVIAAGGQNTCIGSQTDPGSSGASNQTAIGYGTTALNVNDSVTIGNSSVENIYMSRDMDAIVHCSGIRFPDTPIASADANQLDDYEEGTWTMTANNSVTLHAASNLGSYTKVGRLVTCAGQARVNDDNSTAELSLNLPFTSLSTLGEGANLYQGALSIYLATSPASVLWGLVQNEANSIILQLSGQRASAATTPFLATANGYYTFTISYLVG